ncbi:O-antigen/teichoic acid export membrane protein [Geodermatophilus normandii]|uniref:O-antigen/teichoic acid export membrane protein n=1 Tax=Geodermatophilus normandii TaxID=1137989 RepID=A0A317QFN9_9ACTN|nr:hypothetical protein [Geodermatophilus normandii]PWW21889.1 O-antigen/teichoic acid export membrane protein [Geodermatophilus normandii]
MSPTLRRTAAGVADQVVSSGSNYLTALLASLVLAPREFAGFVLAYAVVTVLVAGARAVVGEPLLAHLPTVAAAHRRDLSSAALGAAAVLGVVAAAGCVVLGLAGPGLLAGVLAFAAWVPGVLLADAARFVLLARGDTVRALLVDLTWALVQLSALAVVWAVGSWSVGSLAAAWGVGALAAVVVAAVCTRQGLRPPGTWWAESRYLSGWFTLTSVLGQVQVYLVLVLAGAVLAAVDTAGLRAVQLLVLQPAITLMAAVLVLLTPPMARASAAGDLAALHRARRTALTAMAALGAVVLLAVPLRDVLLGAVFPQYTGYAGIVAPVAVQTAVAALTVPFQAQLRGARRGRSLFVQQVVQLVTLLGGAATGLAAGGLPGLAWGTAAATVVALVSMALAARQAGTGPLADAALPDRVAAT